MDEITVNNIIQLRRKQIECVETMTTLVTTIFFQKRAPVHSKIKPRVYNLTMFCAFTPNTTSLSFSSDTASRRLISY